MTHKPDGLRGYQAAQPEDGRGAALEPIFTSDAPLKSLAQLIDARAEFDLLFIDPRHQVTMLDEYYVDGPGTLDRCLQIHRVMAPTSVAVIPTKIRHLGVVQTELLPRCGFSRIKRLPPRRGTGANLLNAEVLIVAERGRAPLIALSDQEWIDLATTLPPMEFAERIYPTAQNRLNAFATAHRPGWTSLPPNHTWIEVPTL